MGLGFRGAVGFRLGSRVCHVGLERWRRCACLRGEGALGTWFELQPLGEILDIIDPMPRGSLTVWGGGLI